MILDKSSHLLEIVAHLPESTTVKHEKISGKLDVPLRLVHVAFDISLKKPMNLA
jgi:hypothetical protein